MNNKLPPQEPMVSIPWWVDCQDPFPRFVVGRARSQGDVTCRLCKQQYRDHINVDGNKVCPWPKEYPKPEHLKDNDNE